MTQIDEPIFKQVDDILNELINVACNYEKGKDVDLDAKANETNHALQALIANQVREAMIDELNKLSLYRESDDRIDVDFIDWQTIENRIATLKGDDK